MPSLTIKDIPEELLERLRELAERDRRSMTQEVIHLLDEVVAEREDRSRAERQADAWEKLAGRWESDRPADEEIDEIYESRTEGREVNL